MKIIALAQDFGFGPISMLNRAILSLSKNIEVHYFIEEHLVPVLDIRENMFTTIIEKQNFYEDIDFKLYDAAIIACDYELANFLYPKIKKIVIYDMLFWFWPTINVVVNQDILVIAQNFIGVQERAKKYDSVKVVGPLLPANLYRPFKNRKRKGILINLGGFKSPFHHNQEAKIYIGMLQPYLSFIDKQGYDFSIVGGELILSSLKETYPKLEKNIEKLSHSDMMERIYTSKMFFTVSGLGSIYESFFTGTPVYFLPPTNYTQALQLKNIVDNVDNSISLLHSSFLNDSIFMQDREDNYIKLLFDYYQSNQTVINEQLFKDIQNIFEVDEKIYNITKSSDQFVQKMEGPGENASVQYVMEYLTND